MVVLALSLTGEEALLLGDFDFLPGETDFLLGETDEARVTLLIGEVDLLAGEVDFLAAGELALLVGDFDFLPESGGLPLVEALTTLFFFFLRPRFLGEVSVLELDDFTGSSGWQSAWVTISKLSPLLMLLTELPLVWWIDISESPFVFCVLLVI